MTKDEKRQFIKRICNVEGCNKKHKAKGYCANHYKAYKKHGADCFMREPRRDTCSVCGKKIDAGGAKGLCQRHYKAKDRHSNPLHKERNVIKELIEWGLLESTHDKFRNTFVINNKLLDK